MRRLFEYAARALNFVADSCDRAAEGFEGLAGEDKETIVVLLVGEIVHSVVAQPNRITALAFIEGWLENNKKLWRSVQPVDVRFRNEAVIWPDQAGILGEEDRRRAVEAVREFFDHPPFAIHDVTMDALQEGAIDEQNEA